MEEWYIVIHGEGYSYFLLHFASNVVNVSKIILNKIILVFNIKIVAKSKTYSENIVFLKRL